MTLNDKRIKTEKRIAKMEANREAHIAAIVRIELALAGERRTLARQKKALAKALEVETAKLRDAKAVAAALPEATASVQVEPLALEPPLDLGMLGPLPESVPDDDGIPTFLRREPRQFNPYEAEQKAAKEKKAAARAEARKGITRERKEHDAIPTSRRRWDTKRSRWVDSAAT